MSGTFQGFQPRLNMQGFTQIPNEFFDQVLPEIDSLAELKILLATFRKTFGWLSHIDKDTGQAVYKQEDAISYSQFEKLTGLSSPSISSGLSKAIEDGYMVRTEEGTYQGKSAVYRVKLKGEGPPPPDDSGDKEPTPPEPDFPDTTLKIKTDIIQIDIEKDNMPNGLATKDVEDDKESILGDFFGQGQTEEAHTKKKTKSTWKSKDKIAWNCNDFLSYYRDMYELTFGVNFGHITGKERANAKALCDAYGSETVAKVAEYTFKHYKTIHSLPKDNIHFSIFYGWFKTLYAEMNGLTKSDMKTREFDEGKHIDRKDVLSW